MRIAVTGSTGFIGSALTRALRDRGDEVLPIVRQPRENEIGIDLAHRLLYILGLSGQSLEAVDAAVHLAGVSDRDPLEPTALEGHPREPGRRRPPPRQVPRLFDQPPSVLVSGSAVGIYGDRGEEVLDETSAQGAASSPTSAAPGKQAPRRRPSVASGS